MTTLYLFNTEQSARLGDRRSDFNRVNGLGLEAIFRDLLNGNGQGTFYLASQFTNNQKDGLVYNIPTLCGIGDCSLKPSGWTYGMLNCLGFGSLTSEDVTWWNNNVAGHELSIKLLTSSTNVEQSVVGGGNINPYWVIYDFYVSSAPTISNDQSVIVSEHCLLDNIYWTYYNICSKTFSRSVFNSEVRYEVELVVEDDDCVDSRSSETTQGVYITANWKDVVGNQFSEDYTLLFQPDSQHTNGSISMSSSNFKGLMGLKGVTCRFNQGVIRDAGYIKINGHITANKYTVDMLGNTLVPVFNDVTENFIIQFTFEPCCDYPSVISETYSDALAALGIDSAELVMAQVDFDSIEWNGFSLLTDYCCDDVDCDGVEFEGYDEPIYKGVGGGGDNVDITCICDNLALINTTLANKFDGLNGKMDSLIDTIEDKELTVELDDCICDNLESISDKLDSLDDIKDSIDNKVIPVSDVSGISTAINNKQIPVSDVSGISTAINNKQIPVSDVSGITTAINNKQIPVTNVSGIESAITNKQIPVTDVSGLNTSLSNIDSSLGQIDGSIAGGTASIGSSVDDLDISLGGINTSLGGIDTSIDDVGTAISNQSFSVDTTGLTCTDSQGNEEGLACIIKNALNNRDNKGIADVIDDKDMSSYVDVAVEPYDMVNIRRAFKDDDIQEG